MLSSIVIALNIVVNHKSFVSYAKCNPPLNEYLMDRIHHHCLVLGINTLLMDRKCTQFLFYAIIQVPKPFSDLRIRQREDVWNLLYASFCRLCKEKMILVTSDLFHFDQRQSRCFQAR